MSQLLGWPDTNTGQQPTGFGAGVPAPIANRRAIGPSNEDHWLRVDPTGAEKSAAFAIPQLLAYPGAIVAADVKGELSAITTRWRYTLGPVLVFDPFQVVWEPSGCLNPLSHLDRDDPQLVDDADTLAPLPSNKDTPSMGNTQDRFCDEPGPDVTASPITHAVRAEDPTRRTLGERLPSLASSRTPS